MTSIDDLKETYLIPEAQQASRLCVADQVILYVALLERLDLIAERLKNITDCIRNKEK